MNRTPMAYHHTTVFETAWQPFAGILRTGGEYWGRTSSGVDLYGLANRCIAVLPTLRNTKSPHS